MKKVFGAVRRTARKFNIENRAQRVINKEKPIPAPRHDTLSAAKLQEVEMDGTSQQLDNKSLVDRMNQLSVKSLDEPIEVKSKATSDKSKPESRVKVPMPEFGYEEPSFVPEGKVSLKYALHFIASRPENPTEYNTNRFVEETGMSEAQAQAILKHFQMLSVRLPSSSSANEPNSVTLSGAKPLEISDKAVEDKPKV